MISKDDLLLKLWEHYTSQNPSVKQVYDLFIAEGEEVVNDHIAFRTFDDPRVNIDVLSQPFLKAGYTEKGQYTFEAKKLFAKHFEHQGDPLAPRVFISQLKTGEFSPFLRETASRCVDAIPASLLGADELVYSGNVWGTPSFEIYETLRQESEYAGWLYVNGFQANHFTVSVNFLKKLDSIQKVNAFLKEKGFRINDSGGEIKGTPAELLEQSSIRSEMIHVRFIEGLKQIPGCYYEFARRYPDTDGRLYPGFIAKSADKIFESTDFVDGTKKG
ncbi:MAG TPA: DUF1338 domain-containing protein [Bacteroidales bacterium]|nr:DUF1338 domain-containing protein [Bacteroidales bacterium]HRZ75814.1 DUF1338 domain-containing protein [Bacteroidales bacterium]